MDADFLKCCAPYAAVEANVVDATNQLHKFETSNGFPVYTYITKKIIL